MQPTSRLVCLRQVAFRDRDGHLVPEFPLPLPLPTQPLAIPTSARDEAGGEAVRALQLRLHADEAMPACHTRCGRDVAKGWARRVQLPLLLRLVPGGSNTGFACIR